MYKERYDLQSMYSFKFIKNEINLNKIYSEALLEGVLASVLK